MKRGVDAVSIVVVVGIGAAMVALLGRPGLLAVPVAFAVTRYFGTHRKGLVMWLTTVGFIGVLLVYLVPTFKGLYDDIGADVEGAPELLLETGATLTSATAIPWVAIGALVSTWLIGRVKEDEKSSRVQTWWLAVTFLLVGTALVVMIIPLVGLSEVLGLILA